MGAVRREIGPLCAVAAVALVLATGCGMSAKKLDEIQGRIKTLKSNGVPDTLVQSAEVLLYQFTTARASTNPAVASSRPNADSLIYFVERAEKWYAEESAKAQPAFTACRDAARTASEQLSGLHKKSVDSLAAIADSLAGKNWHIQASRKCDDLSAIVAAMNAAQLTADKLTKTIAGRWKSIRDVTGEGAKAAETRVITLNKDGSLYYTHEMKGKTSQTLQEDWQFLSWGTWSLKGDTVHLAVSREKCARQNFSFLRANGWETKKSPTYDSTITNGSKDLMIVYSDLKDEFVRF